MLKITLMYFDELTIVCTYSVDFETYAADRIVYFVDCDGLGEEWRIPATWIKSIQRA